MPADSTHTKSSRFGFVIDHRRCIGCHACTVACKSENEVPVGDFRTWVKYVDKGIFPEVRRHFTVLRCNHCDAAPCVEICPTVALHKRTDAIVDLDRDRCIGCRSCMQACPYDALYLNEDTGTAEKCHYCAHRTELGFEPACVVVCPAHAIIPGNVADPGSEIATLIREEKTSQRKVEKGTKPRVWYVDALDEALVPGSASEPPEFIWAERPTPQPAIPPGFDPPPADLVTAFDVGHAPVWGWHIWSYLVTKNVAAGAMMVAPFLTILGVTSAPSTAMGVLPELVALVFMGLTGFFLVHDLGRPERFLKIVFTPNPRSWLVRGTWILIGFGALCVVSLGLRVTGDRETSDLVRWINLPFAIMASGYTAFLFWQCRGRDLWLGKDLFPHLLGMAGLMGAGVALVMAAPDGRFATAEMTFVGFALVNVLWFSFGRYLRSATEDGDKAHAVMYASGGPRLARLPLYVSVVCVLFSGNIAGGSTAVEMIFRLVAVVMSIVGLTIYERSWVRAGQEVPIS